MTTIPQNPELLKNLLTCEAIKIRLQTSSASQEGLELLIMAEVFTFGRHTTTQLLLSLGLTEQGCRA